MALPENGIPWPPKALTNHLRDITLSAAWYAGDPAALATVYGGPNAASFNTSSDPTRRRFWSRRGRDRTGTPRPQLHVPLPADIAATSATLLFGTPPAIRGDGLPPEVLTKIIEDEFHNVLLESAEVASALGEVYLRPSWDRNVSEVAFLVSVHPDAVVPTFRYGRLVAATFWTDLEIAARGKIIRHVEHHEMRGNTWWIEHALYEGTKDTIGIRVDLTAHPATADYPEEVDTGVPFLGVQHVPNIRPSRKARHSPHGRSDFDGADGLFDALDETWTSWMRDVRLGKARLIIPETFMETEGPSKGQYFDEDREMFHPVNVPTSATEGLAQLHEVQFDIRWEEHQTTALALVERIVDNAGYSPQDFGLHIEGRAESGTALRIRRGRSIATVERKRRYWTPALRRSILALLQLQSKMMQDKEIADIPDTLTVDWPEEVDLTERSTAVEMLTRAAAASTQTKVEMVNPDWTDTEVTEEVARILAEQGVSVPAPGDITEME